MTLALGPPAPSSFKVSTGKKVTLIIYHNRLASNYKSLQKLSLNNQMHLFQKLLVRIAF